MNYEVYITCPYCEKQTSINVTHTKTDIIMTPHWCSACGNYSEITFIFEDGEFTSMTTSRATPPGEILH